MNTHRLVEIRERLLELHVEVEGAGDKKGARQLLLAILKLDDAIHDLDLALARIGNPSTD